jgi:hypothetical protein
VQFVVQVHVCLLRVEFQPHYRHLDWRSELLGEAKALPIQY